MGPSRAKDISGYWPRTADHFDVWFRLHIPPRPHDLGGGLRDIDVCADPATSQAVDHILLALHRAKQVSENL
jgi:hypothetical protein